MATPRAGLERLRRAAASGELDNLCQRHGIQLLTVFGSTARDDARAHDLDVGVLTGRAGHFDAVAVTDELIQLTDVADLDLAHLDRGGPLIRERALVGSIVLYESRPGVLATAQMTAVSERMETDRFRRLALDLLAS